MDTKLQRLNSLEYQLCQLKNLYSDVLCENIGLAMQFAELINTVDSLAIEADNEEN